MKTKFSPFSRKKELEKFISIPVGFTIWADVASGAFIDIASASLIPIELVLFREVLILEK